MQEEEYTIPEMVDEVREGKMQRRQFMKRLTLMVFLLLVLVR